MIRNPRMFFSYRQRHRRSAILWGLLKNEKKFEKNFKKKVKREENKN
jgi:hypothetical protein